MSLFDEFIEMNYMSENTLTKIRVGRTTVQFSVISYNNFYNLIEFSIIL